MFTQTQSTTFAYGKGTEAVSPSQQWFNTREGIREKLQSLSQLQQLVAARKKVQHQEELTRWYILQGKFLLDQFGQVMKVLRLPGNVEEKLPLVANESEFSQLLEEHATDEQRMFIAYTGAGVLPNKYTECPYCKTGWDISTITDTFAPGHKIVVLEGEEYVGNTLERAYQVAQRIHAKKHLTPLIDRIIRNDIWMDTRPDIRYPTASQVNPGGIKQKVSLDYVLQAGDGIYMFEETLYHPSCLRKKVSANYKAKFKEIFEAAGIQVVRFNPRPNERFGNMPCEPDWFLVSTDIGPIKVGKRKRVFVLDWSRTTKSITSGQIEADRIITHDKQMLHCWGFEKMQEYLTKIMNS